VADVETLVGKPERMESLRRHTCRLKDNIKMARLFQFLLVDLTLKWILETQDETVELFGPE